MKPASSTSGPRFRLGASLCRHQGREGRTLPAVLFLALLPAILFGRALLMGVTLAYDDLQYWFYPWKQLLYQMASARHINFWLPSDFSGMPHMADIQRQIFYPPNLVFYLLPTAQAMVIFVGFHFFLAALLMYAFLRRMPLDEEMGHAGAVCGGAVFAFCAFPLLHLSQLPMLASYAWIPGVLMAIDAWWQRPQPRVLVAGGLVYCMMVLGGAPQVVFIGSCLAVAYGFFVGGVFARDLPVGRWLSALAGLALIPLLGLGLSALQLLPMAELASYSTRQQEVPSAYSSIGTAHPRMLATFLAPYAYGNPRTGNYVGGAYTFHEECFYVGVVTLVLAGACLGSLPRNRARVLFFLAAALAGVVIALGNHLEVGGIGLHDVTRRLVPLFGKFRVPPRWMILTDVGMAVIAALGFNALVRFRARGVLTGMRPKGRPTWTVEGAFVAVAAVMGGLLWLGRAHLTFNPDVAWVQFVAVLAACTLGLVYFTAFRASWAGGILLTLLSLELLVFGWRYVLLSPPPEQSPNLAVLRDLGARPGRFRVATHTDTRIPTQVATWAGVFGVDNIQGSNPLFLRPYFEYLYFSQAGTLPNPGETGYMHHNGFFVMGPRESAMTRLLNLKYKIELDRTAGLGPAGDGSVEIPAVPLRVEEIGGALGEVRFVPQYRVLGSRPEVFSEMMSTEFQPEQVVLLEQEPGVSLRPATGGEASPKIVLEEASADRLRVRADVGQDGFLLFSEIYYPGWRATVDGREAPVLVGNGIFRTVPVTAGRHEVTLRYLPSSFRNGLGVTLLTSLGMALGVVLGGLPGRRRPRSWTAGPLEAAEEDEHDTQPVDEKDLPPGA